MTPTNNSAMRRMKRTVHGKCLRFKTPFINNRHRRNKPSQYSRRQRSLLLMAMQRRDEEMMVKAA